MPLYPMIDWNSNLLDPRGYYLNLNILRKKKKSLNGHKLITSKFLGEYQINVFSDLETQYKDLTSPYYHKNLRYIQIHNEFLFFSKQKLSCTNSYLKIWEMLSFMVSENILHPHDYNLVFFDAEFPGNFMNGMDNFLKNFKNANFDWLASSLLPCEENTALNDIYGFYKNEPDRWLMNDKISGDVVDLLTYEHHYQYIENYTKGDGVNIYVCDLGIQHNITNFHVQEQENIIPQICSVLKGMSILKKNGILLCKIYSALEKKTRHLLSMIQYTFKNVFLCKPSSSRGRNKELYILAYGYEKKFTYEEIKSSFINKSPIYTKEMHDLYLTAEYASQFFAFRQLTWLEKMKREPLETSEKDYENYAEKYIQYLGI